MIKKLHNLHRCELKQWQKSGYKNSDSIKYIFANLNDAAYKPSYKDKQEVLNKSKLNREYHIISEYSSRDYTVFYDNDCKKHIIVFKGTDDKNRVGRRFNDIYTDVLLGIGQVESTKYYKAADEITKKLIDKYGASNIILSGHSLGGRAAGGLSMKYELPAIIYNEGSSILDFKYNRAENKYTTHFTTNSLSNLTIDPLSISSVIASNKKHIVVAGDTDDKNTAYLKQHSLKHFLDKNNKNKL
jgi:predicted esterase YcpF (UPF0227 family)